MVSPRGRGHAGILLACVAAALLLQLYAGAYVADRGTYSDEAAHFMNGLLIRDYIYDGLGENPMTFAERYYQRFPKIAMGMWPPLFHVTLGVVLLPGWRPDVAALVLVAVFSAWTIWRLHDIVSRMAGALAGLWSAALFVMTPLVILLTSTVMIDVMVGALALEGAYWLVRFSESGTRRHAILFGIAGALCCAAKGNGISLIFAPAVLLLLTGRYHLLARSGLYIAAAIVVVIAVPPLLVSYRLDAAIGDFSPLTFKAVSHRLSFYGHTVYGQLGPVILSLAVTGIGAAIAKSRQPGEPWALGLASLIAGAFLFHTLSPHTVSDQRYMELTFAPIIGLAAYGTHLLAQLARKPGRALPGLIFLVTFACSVWRPMPIQKPTALGYRSVVDALAAGPGYDGRRVLVISAAPGEGAMVTEIARRRPSPATVVIRGSKLVSDSDWMGWTITLKYSSPDQLMALLEDLHVNYLVLDFSAESRALPYWTQVQEMLTTHQTRFDQVYSTMVDAEHEPIRPLVVYRLKHQSPGAPRPVPVDLGRYTLRQ